MLTLVTGATGLVGNNVARLLLARGESLRVLIREKSNMRPFAGLDVEIVHGDVRDAKSVVQACHGVNRVIHSAALVRIGRTGLELQREINVEGTRNVARAARKNGASMVHVSSCDTIGINSLAEPADEDTPQNPTLQVPYVITKREAEKVLQGQISKGLKATIVNPGFMLGPWDWKPSSGEMLLTVARGKAWVAPRGWGSFCDVRDVAEGILAAAEKGATGRRYIMAGITMSYLDAWRLFAEVTGARRPLFAVGPVVSLLVGWIGDLQGKITGREPQVNSGAIALARLLKNYTSARAEAELGYQIRPLRETVEDAWEWFQQQGYS